jgi:hypothetical protein
MLNLRRGVPQAGYWARHDYGSRAVRPDLQLRDMRDYGRLSLLPSLLLRRGVLRIARRKQGCQFVRRFRCHPSFRSDDAYCGPPRSGRGSNPPIVQQAIESAHQPLTAVHPIRLCTRALSNGSNGHPLPCRRGIGMVRCAPNSGPHGSVSGLTPLRHKPDISPETIAAPLSTYNG